MCPSQLQDTSSLIYRPSHPVFWSLDVMYTQYKIIMQYLMVGNPILRWDRPVMEEVLASQVSSCFSSLQLTAAFHEMVLLFQHVFRSLNETGCHTAGKALPHPCLKGKKTGLTQDRASRLQFGLTQDQAATHPLLPWTFIVQSKFHWYTLRWNSFAIVCLCWGRNSDYIHDDGWLKLWAANTY